MATASKNRIMAPPELFIILRRRVSVVSGDWRLIHRTEISIGRRHVSRPQSRSVFGSSGIVSDHRRKRLSAAGAADRAVDVNVEAAGVEFVGDLLMQVGWKPVHEC